MSTPFVEQTHLINLCVTELAHPPVIWLVPGPALLRCRGIDFLIPEYFGGRDMGCLRAPFAFWPGLLRPARTFAIRCEAHLLGQLLQGRYHLRWTHVAENLPLVLRDGNHHAVRRL